VSNLSSSSAPRSTLAPLMLGAMGVVYGDIGTSPLYAFKESLNPDHMPDVTVGSIYGIVSMMFWLLMIIVTIKYVAIVLFADNKGEGGDFALLALNLKLTSHRPWLHYGISLLGILGGCLFYADAIITPAISVLSAVEGVKVYYEPLGQYIIPSSLTILILLFCIQRFGTGKVGTLFGPITLIWFLAIGTLGLLSILQAPEVLWGLSPHYALQFIFEHPVLAFYTGGAVVLVITGAEALYADMGHFGRLPIQLTWFFVLICLMLNYLGQASLVIRSPELIVADNFNPFFMLVPEVLMIPMVILATMAAVIASQATISGAYSITRQAIQLGYLPRLRIFHTSSREMGQIYIPFINWAMLTAVILVVVLFKSSSGLASAYGIAVVGAMLTTTFAISIVIIKKWHWPLPLVIVVLGFFLTLEGALLVANITKVFSGGWLPLTTALILFTFLTTWFRGQRILYHTMSEKSASLRDFVAHLVKDNYRRVPGTAVYMTPRKHLVPEPMILNLRHNKILHERIVLLTILVTNEPKQPDDERFEIQDMADNFYRVILRYGFLEEPNLEKDLSTCKFADQLLLGDDVTFILGRESIVPTPGSGMAVWREHLYAWMKRNAGSAADFYRVPSGKMIEIGGQYEI
jgi:KUP system potassium uptake protein